MESIAKLKWQCRRGTKELDLLLENYLTSLYNESTNEEKALFKELLSLQDTKLIWFLLGNQLPDSKGLSILVKKIRSNGKL